MLVVASAVKDVDGVGQQVGDGFKGLDGALGAAGQIDDDGVAADDGDGAREYSGGTFLHAFAAHFFGDAWDDTVGYGNSGFRGIVAGAEAGAAGGKDEVDAAGVGDGAELFANAGGIVSETQRGGNFPIEAATESNHGGTGEIFAFAFRGGIADGEDGYAHGEEELLGTFLGGDFVAAGFVHQTHGFHEQAGGVLSGGGASGSIGGIEIDFKFAFGPKQDAIDGIVAVQVATLGVATLAAGEV